MDKLLEYYSNNLCKLINEYRNNIDFLIECEKEILLDNEKSLILKYLKEENFKDLEKYILLSIKFNSFLIAHKYGGIEYGQSYEIALNEIKKGKKITDWIWYIFPVNDEFDGMSDMFNYYKLSYNNICEYVLHPILYERLLLITRELLLLNVCDINDIFNLNVDVEKLKNCMLTFYKVTNNDLFMCVFKKYLT
jgi:uncharacterized protein (DUF1810 family)